jgi:hypothetical protein
MGTLTPLFIPVADIPLVHDEGTIAYIIEIATGAIVDSTSTIDTALNYIQDLGHVAVAVADEIHWCGGKSDCYYCETYGPVVRTQEELQRAFDHEREIQEDCFGLQTVRVA